MDSGVGSFVFSLGIISALPIVKRSPISRSLTVDIWQSTKKTIPLLVLGLVRILFVKGVDYPEHVTEYGVHWNFFFTLSILPMAGVLARRIFESYRVNLALVGLSLSLVFQLLLSLGGLQEYVLSSIPRTNLIAANREGLISLPGYLIIYLFGLSTGCYLLPPSPSFLQKIGRNPNTPSSLKSTPQLGKSLVVCSSWSIIWWTLYLLFNTFVSPASRRLANPTYCFWIVANNLTVITGHGLIHQLDLTRQPSPRVTTPKLFEAINQNSLAVFLIANLMTGLINVSVHTIYLSNLVSIVILIGYTILVVCFSWKIKRFKLKF